MTIRRAAAGDTEFVLGLVSSFVDFGLPDGRDAGETAAVFARELEEALRVGAELYIAEDDTGRALGFVHLASAPDLVGRRRAYVADLAVAAEAQARGVGRELMAFAEDWARDHGHDRIALTAFATNRRALGFYERLGYAPDTLVLTKAIASR